MPEAVKFDFSDISRALGVAPAAGAGSAQGTAQGVSIDSRTLAAGQLFVAVRGKRFDGNLFAAQALKQGAAAAVVEQNSPHPALSPDRGEGVGEGKVVPVWIVPDGVQALGKLARFHRDRFKTDLVAITGSSGKSTTKTMLAHLLSEDRNVLATPGTQNNQVGVPLTLFQLQAAHQAVVLELGTNQWGEIRALAEICRPTVGAVINIGPAHLQTFGDLDGVLKAKGELWEAMDPSAPLVLNGDDPLLVKAGGAMRRKIIWFGTGAGAEVRAEEIRLEPLSSTCRVNGEVELRLPAPGRHNVMNALAALACARALGVDLAAAAKRLGTFAPLPGRMNIREQDGLLLLDDSYNANPGSLSAALEVLKGLQRPGGRKVVALGDMLELGSGAEALHDEAGRKIVEAGAGGLVTVGKLAGRALASARKSGLPADAGFSFETPEEAGEFLAGFLRSGDALLLKGSRGIQLERLLTCFTTSSTR